MASNGAIVMTALVSSIGSGGGGATGAPATGAAIESWATSAAACSRAISMRLARGAAAVGTGLNSCSKSTVIGDKSGAAAPAEGRAVDNCIATPSQVSPDFCEIDARRTSSSFEGAVFVPVCKRAS